MRKTSKNKSNNNKKKTLISQSTFMDFHNSFDFLDLNVHFRDKNCSRRKHQICVDRFIMLLQLIHEINTIFHHSLFDWCFFDHIISLCPLLLQRLKGSQLENQPHQLFISMSPTPDIPITVEDGNAHSFAFSCANFLQIWLNFALHVHHNPVIDAFTI